MPLPNPYNEAWYNGDGVTKTFAFGYNSSDNTGFDAISADYVKCHIIFQDGSVVIPIFTVDIESSAITIVSISTAGGVVLNAPPINSQVRIFRDVPETQDLDSESLKNYTNVQMAKVLDRIVAMIQEVQSQATHNVPQMQEGFRDAEIQWLTDLNQLQLLFWDNNNRKFKPTDWTTTDARKVIDEAVRSAGLTVKNMEWDGSKVVISFASGSKNAVVSDNIVQIRANYVDNKYIFQYSLDGITWRGVASGMLHNDLLDRDAEDSHPISAISGLQEKLTTIDENIDKKLDINQGTDNVGKVLKVGTDGNVVASSEAAGLASVNHDETMEGAGTKLSPLKISKTVLSEIAGKQPAGDYATSEELEQGLAEKANKTDVVDLSSSQTITGRKTFGQPIVQTNRGLALSIIDSSGAKVASFGSLDNKENLNEAFMYVYNDDGSINSWLSLYYNNGASYAVVGPSYNLPTSDNNNKLASTAFVHALLSQVINDSNIGSNYVYIGDLLIQWGVGQLSGNSNLTTVTLPIPMSNNNYAITTSCVGDADNNAAKTVWLREVQNTYFTINGSFAANASADYVAFYFKWIAIGQGA